MVLHIVRFDLIFIPPPVCPHSHRSAQVGVSHDPNSAPTYSTNRVQVTSGERRALQKTGAIREESAGTEMKGKGKGRKHGHTRLISGGPSATHLELCRELIGVLEHEPIDPILHELIKAAQDERS